MSEIKLDPEQSEALAKVIAEYLREEKPYLVDLDDMIRSIQNGVIEVSFRVYNGKVTDIVLGKIVQRKTYK